MLGASDLAAIGELEQRWTASELAGRVSEVLELCTPDVVWLPPGRPPIRGKAAIREWLERSSDRIKDIRLSEVTVAGDSLTAYKIANFQTRWLPSGSTEAVTIKGWHFWVLRRHGEFGWRVAVVAWSVVES